MSNIIKNIGNWIANEFVAIQEFITKEEKTLKPYLQIADNLVNFIKNMTSTPEGKFVITTIETVVPSSTKLLDALILQLPIWVVDLNWTINEIGKTPEEQFSDGVAYLKTIKDPDVYAVQLNSLKALITKFFANNNAALLTIQQSLILAQPDHSANSKN